jgi:isopentenyl-diphosphate delta-isomerase
LDDEQERVILVDGNDRPVGSAGKLAAHRQSLLHRAVSVFVFDRAGRVLLQKRADAKYHSGGLWSNTCCSHPRPGEMSATAARRRLLEEMGIDTQVEFAFSLLYQVELSNGLVEHEFDHVFFACYDGVVTPDAAEVCDWRYVDPQRVSRELAGEPGRFTAWFGRCWAEVLLRRSEFSPDGPGPAPA